MRNSNTPSLVFFFLGLVVLVFNRGCLAGGSDSHFCWGEGCTSGSFHWPPESPTPGSSVNQPPPISHGGAWGGWGQWGPQPGNNNGGNPWSWPWGGPWGNPWAGPWGNPWGRPGPWGGNPPSSPQQQPPPPSQTPGKSPPPQLDIPLPTNLPPWLANWIRDLIKWLENPTGPFPIPHELRPLMRLQSSTATPNHGSNAEEATISSVP